LRPSGRLGRSQNDLGQNNLKLRIFGCNPALRDIMRRSWRHMEKFPGFAPCLFGRGRQATLGYRKMIWDKII